MKDKILKIVKELVNQLSFDECIYTFWMNEKEQTPIRGLPFNKGSILTIGDILDVDIENFNLTIEFKDGKDNKDVTKWYRCQIVFWGDKNKISYDFDFLSTLTSIRYGEIGRHGNDEVNFDKLSLIINDLIFVKQTLINNNNILLDKFKKMKYD